MTLFGKRSSDASPRTGLLEDIEKLWRRVRVVALGTPLLVVFGFGAGRVTSEALALPESELVRASTGEATPRIHLEALSRRLDGIREKGTNTTEYVELYKEHIEPVERVLRKRGLGAETARRVAWPLVEESYKQGLSPTMVMAVMLIESRGRPNAVSPVGARGLMQVMPLWSGYWRNCGADLYDIESNLCNGTSILAWYLKRAKGDVRRALLGYNGCVNGTNTPDCHTYPDKVNRIKTQLERELRATHVRGVPLNAAGP